MEKKEETIKTYKGFDKDLKCRDFQYEVGKTYETDRAELCEEGFHAISTDDSPLTAFGYYAPCDESGQSRYCEVEVSGDVDKGDDKICGKKITIGAEIGIPGLVKAHVEWVKEHIEKENTQSNTGNCSAATNTGNRSAAEVSGKGSIAIATGYESKVKGELGCAIVVAERGEWNGNDYPLLAVCSAIVDGKNIKADTWYTAKDGKLVEVE